jgi:hypothetical protein
MLRKMLSSAAQQAQQAGREPPSASAPSVPESAIVTAMGPPATDRGRGRGVPQRAAGAAATGVGAAVEVGGAGATPTSQLRHSLVACPVCEAQVHSDLAQSHVNSHFI